MTLCVVAASEAAASLWRRAFDWWLVQVKHVLPPTIFFFFGFNLILFMIVRSGHSVQGHAEAIEEIRRILLEHLGSTGSPTAG